MNLMKASLNPDINSGILYLRFTPKIQKVLGCTIFNVLNRIEKLDGSINILHPKWTLELQVPLGEKKGLFQWECTIMHPVHVNIASPVATVDKADEKSIEEGIPEKKSLWKRLFGK